MKKNMFHCLTLKTFILTLLIFCYGHKIFADPLPGFSREGIDISDLDTYHHAYEKAVSDQSYETYKRWSIQGTLFALGIGTYLVTPNLITAIPAIEAQALAHADAVKRLGTLVNLIFNPFMITGLIQGSLREILESTYDFLLGKKVEEDYFLTIETYKNYIDLKNNFSEENKKRIHQKLNRLKEYLLTVQGKPQEAAKPKIFFIHKILSLPSEPLTLNNMDHINNAESKKIRKALSELKKNYSDDVKKIIDNIYLSLISNGAQNKTGLFFLGPPGTGKTRLAEELAKAVDLPFIELSGSDKSRQIFGSANGFDGDGSIQTFSTKLISKTTSKGKKPAAGIVFIDEIEKPLNAGMFERDGAFKENLLKLLEPTRTVFNLKDLDVDFDFKNYTFILAGNETVRDAAFMSRLKVITFKAFDENSRKNIGLKFFDEIIKEKNKVFPEFKPTDEEKSYINQIIAYDHQHNPGVRILRLALEDYINFLLKKYVTKKNTELTDFFETDDEFNIENVFKKYNNKASPRSTPNTPEEDELLRSLNFGADIP